MLHGGRRIATAGVPAKTPTLSVTYPQKFPARYPERDVPSRAFSAAFSSFFLRFTHATKGGRCAPAHAMRSIALNLFAGNVCARNPSVASLLIKKLEGKSGTRKANSSIRLVHLHSFSFL